MELHGPENIVPKFMIQSISSNKNKTRQNYFHYCFTQYNFIEDQYQKILTLNRREHRPFSVQCSHFMVPSNPHKVSWHNCPPNRDDHDQIHVTEQS